MKRLIQILTAFGLLTSAHPVLAKREKSKPETQTGTLIPGVESAAPVLTSGRYVREPLSDEAIAAQKVPLPDTVAMATFYKFAGCVAKRDGQALKVFYQKPQNWAETSAVLWPGAQRTLDICLGKSGNLSMNGKASMFLGGWAQELYLKSYPTLPALADVDKSSTGSVTSRRDAMMYEFAQCLTVAAPVYSDYLIRTVAGSPEEGTAVKFLSQKFSGCFPANGTLSTNKLTLRLAIAHALYRRAVGAELTSSGKVK